MDEGDWDKQLIDEQLAEHLRQSREPDPLGKRALFSVSNVRPGPFGVLALECSSCKRESPVRFRDIPRLTFPVTVTLPRQRVLQALAPLQPLGQERHRDPSPRPTRQPRMRAPSPYGSDTPYRATGGTR